jgi:hypothetical protein
MKVYEDNYTKILKAKLKEGRDSPDPAPKLFVNKIDNALEKLYMRYLTDRTLQMYNYEIFMLMNTATSIQYKYDGENLVPLFSPDRAYEIKRIMNLRDEYIRSYYPKLIVEEKKK